MPEKSNKADRTKYAIEDSFPIVEINRLAVPERNSFKPIYQMHKWFARRASCVFRAILLGCMKPLPVDKDGNPTKSGAEVIMDEFYKDHTDDPDTKGKVILDPFMGGGTTIVEALRLGCNVIGIDLNPVAWFIVKTEVEPVDIDELKKSFERLAERKVSWSGKSVKDTLLDQYKTECPCCGGGREDADIIYNFWVKSAVCTNPLCKKEVPLFNDYIVAAKSPSIRYYRDAECSECGKTFDWEIEPASLIAERGLSVVSPSYSAGVGRTNARWAYSSGEEVECPWCGKTTGHKAGKIKGAPIRKTGSALKKERKKVELTVLLCPECYSVWQWRGKPADEVKCPVCGHVYDPGKGNVPQSGWFLCSCGHTDKIINSIRSLPEEQLLPMRLYAIEGYCERCAGGIFEEEDQDQLLLDGNNEKKGKKKKGNVDHQCFISKNNGKFFKRIKPVDLTKYQKAVETWEKEKKNLPYPKQKVPDGQETHRLLEHHYQYWHQMFNPRQLLCLSTLIMAIDKEPNQVLKEMLLSGFYNLLNNMSDFTSYIWQRDCTRQVFARHDFAPKSTSCESTVWGTDVGMGNFKAYFEAVIEGKKFGLNPSDRKFSGEYSSKKSPILEETESGESVYFSGNTFLISADSRNAISAMGNDFPNFVITDPPYASNVNYSELSDYFYVWLKLILGKKYPYFAPDFTPKRDEIVENPTRNLSIADFENGLKTVFEEVGKKIDKDGVLAFTFHHAEGSAWESILKSICESGYFLESIYPIHGEPEASLHLQDKKAISYDLIHVCRKRPVEDKIQARSWAGIRQEIRRKAREEIKAIEKGRYGNEPLSPEDINIVLIGKCLELYSRHYGAVIDHEGKEFPLKEALTEIRMMVDQLQRREEPLPSELSEIEPESYIYLTSLCHIKEIKSDAVHKATRGVIEPDSLLKAGLMIKGRAGKGRTYEVKQPIERIDALSEKFRETLTAQENLFGEVEVPKTREKRYFIDYVHYLMALAESGENIVPWLERFRGETPRLRAAFEYLKNKNPRFAGTIKKIMDLIDIGPLFTKG